MSSGWPWPQTPELELVEPNAEMPHHFHPLELPLMVLTVLRRVGDRLHTLLPSNHVVAPLGHIAVETTSVSEA